MDQPLISDRQSDASTDDVPEHQGDNSLGRQIRRLSQAGPAINRELVAAADIYTEQQPVNSKQAKYGLDQPPSDTCWAPFRRLIGRLSLTQRTLIGAALGLIIGVIVQKENPSEGTIICINYLGKLFINALKLIVMPLIALNMIMAVNKLGDISKTKKIGKRALIYYLSTTVLAATEGLLVFYLFNPGTSVVIEPSDPSNDPVQDVERKNLREAILGIGESMIPDNLVTAYAITNILGIIVFSLLFGIALSLEPPEESIRVTRLVETSNNALMRMVRWIITFTPLGIMSLIAGAIAAQDNLSGLLRDLGMFIVTVIVGLAFHVLVVYPLIYAFFVRRNPFNYYKKISQAIITAFATSSSAATMPITIKCVEGAGINTDITRFILPLGATINMDGSAIYFPVAALFIANMLGEDMNVGQRVVTAVMSAFVSIGAAPIPSAGLVYLVLILDSAGIPVGPQVAFVLAVDWFLDRCQTCVNVCGDSVGAAVLHRLQLRDDAKEEIASYTPDPRASFADSVSESDMDDLSANPRLTISSQH